MSDEIKIFNSYREKSRINWGQFLPKDTTLCIDQIRLGCELRSADALENILTVIRDIQFMSNCDRRELDEYRKQNGKLKRLIKKQRDEIAKLRGDPNAKT